MNGVFTTLLRSPLTGARHSIRMSGNIPAVARSRLDGVRASLSAFTEAFRASYSPRTDAELEAAARSANIHDTIVSFPDAFVPRRAVPLAPPYAPPYRLK